MRIGIIGSGSIGATVGKLWVDAGHDVRFSSRHPDVKAFNSVYYRTLASEAHRKGDLVGIPLAGDDKDAVETVARLVRDGGFDPVPDGAPARGREFEPGTPPYTTGTSGRELRKMFG